VNKQAVIDPVNVDGTENILSKRILPFKTDGINLRWSMGITSTDANSKKYFKNRCQADLRWSRCEELDVEIFNVDNDIFNGKHIQLMQGTAP